MDDVTEMFRKAGNDVDEQEVKLFVKELFGIKTKIIMPDGEVKYTLKSTADYDTAEIEDLMTKVRAWGATFGFQFCFPNEGGYT